MSENDLERVIYSRNGHLDGRNGPNQEPSLVQVVTQETYGDPGHALHT